MDLLKRFGLPILVLCAFLFLLRVFFLDTYPDLRTYYFAPQAFFAGQDPYLGGDAFTEFIYPPFALLFFSPFLLLPYFFFEKLWIILSLACLVLSLHLLLKLFNEPLFSTKSMIVYIGAFFFFPVKFTLGMGQINNFILLLVTIAIFLFFQKKQSASGFFLGLCLSIKLFPLLLMGYFGLAKQWKTFSLAVITFIILTGVGYLVSPSLFERFFVHTFPSLLSSWKIDYYNQALSGLLSRSFDNQQLVSHLQFVISAVLLFVSTFAIWPAKRKNQYLQFGVVITLSLLINPFSWQHHFVLLLIPFVFLLEYISLIKSNRLIGYGLLAVSYLLVGLNISNPRAFPTLFQSHVFFGALLLWMMHVYYLLHKS